MSYTTKVGNWIEQQTGCTLGDLCRKFRYYSIAQKIIALDENDERKTKLTIARDSELKHLYEEFAKNPKALSLRGQKRSWTQYFKDLITGWILEDLTMEMLRREGLDIKHNGVDGLRHITIANKVTQAPDFTVTVGNYSRKVELTNEMNHLLENMGYIEKRAPSLYKIWAEKGIWIYRVIDQGKYVLVDFATERVMLHLRWHDSSSKGWSKDVYRYILSENNKRERDDRLLASEIISVVGCSIEGKEQPPLTEVEDEDSPPRVFTIGGKLREKAKEKPQDKKMTDNTKVRETQNKGATPSLPPKVITEEKKMELAHETMPDTEESESFDESEFGNIDFV